MTTDLQALYQDTILEHHRQPRNFRALAGGHKAEGHNPLCGDRLTVFVLVRDGLIEDVSFQGVGCAIATASASLMTEQVKGKAPEEVDRLCALVQHMVASPEGETIQNWGELAPLAGVRRFPVRAKCALLPWQTLRAAVAAGDEIVSTE